MPLTDGLCGELNESRRICDSGEIAWYIVMIATNESYTICSSAGYGVVTPRLDASAMQKRM